MITKLSVLLIVVMVAGCVPTIWGPAGEYEGAFECEGKGTITGSGHLDIGAGVGGGQGNAWTMMLDCGDHGLKIKRYRERIKPVVPVTGSPSAP